MGELVFEASGWNKRAAATQQLLFIFGVCTTIRPNTNTLFGLLFGPNRIFGTSLVQLQLASKECTKWQIWTELKYVLDAVQFIAVHFVKCTERVQFSSFVCFVHTFTESVNLVLHFSVLKNFSSNILVTVTILYCKKFKRKHYEHTWTVFF